MSRAPQASLLSAKNQTLFATLPTGGGKSLCYLLPALMRYQRRNMLTIVISPLQALMKDQVDNFLKQTGTKLAAALYGMLTMPERGEIVETVRLGDVGILFVSPEQLRNQSFINTISQREIAQFLRGLRYATKGEESVVLTAGELLRLNVVEIDQEEHPDAITQVNTAVSWLERSGFLERNENHTRFFQGKPLVRSLDEATEKMAKLNLSKRQEARWLAILAVLMERRPNQAFSADELAGRSAFTTTPEDPPNETETLRVIRTLNDMAEQGLISKETILSAYLRYKVQNSAEKQLQGIVLLEKDFLKVLQETAPKVDLEAPLEIDLRQVNQLLLDMGH
ncbi:MAG: ATP-dependent DNA helicase RecQ [Desulfobulbaceae bacterium]|nr:ATP-dependent DNA helicase RecQ [Desulfobulbaceae bacterium]